MCIGTVGDSVNRLTNHLTNPMMELVFLFHRGRDLLSHRLFMGEQPCPAVRRDSPGPSSLGEI